jgi:hypothetical protein
MKKKPNNETIDNGNNLLEFKTFEDVGEIAWMTIAEEVTLLEYTRMTFVLRNHHTCRKIAKKLLKIAEWMEQND